MSPGIIDVLALADSGLLWGHCPACLYISSTCRLRRSTEIDCLFAGFAGKSDHLIQSNLACVLLSLGRFEEALCYANKSCDLQPAWPKVPIMNTALAKIHPPLTYHIANNYVSLLKIHTECCIMSI